MSIFNQITGEGILSESVEQTQAIAFEVATLLPENASIGFNGNLGSGKTTFICGMVRAWGISEPVKSPSYNIMNIYQGDRQIIHMDAYRLKSADDLDGLMLDDISNPPWMLLVEWPSNIDNYLPEPLFEINMQIENNMHRISMKLPK